jgi:hypothetical protein
MPQYSNSRIIKNSKGGVSQANANSPLTVLQSQISDVTTARNHTNEHAGRYLKLLLVYVVLFQMDILRSITFNRLLNHR